MRRVSVVAVAALLMVPIAARAQVPGGGAAPAQQAVEWKNLQVLPDEITRDSLNALMRGFTQALGVRCTHCHTTARGATNPDSLDFALDDKEAKDKARFMMGMVRTINGDLLDKIPSPHNPRLAVTCTTCHRGSPLPGTIDQVLTMAIDSAGVQSAVARYRQMRGATSLEQGKYDFSETPVNELARRLTTMGRRTDAIALLEMNAELHPASAGIEVQLGDIYRTSGDAQRAIARYQAALQKDANNQNARRRLNELTGAAPAAPAGQPGAGGQRPAQP